LNFLDIVIILFLAVTFILGFKDGFVRKLIGTVGFFLSVYLGIKLSGYGGVVLGKLLSVEPEFARVLGGFFIFVLCIIITSIIKRLVHPFDKVNNLINRIVGGVVGSLQILIFLSAAFYLMGIFNYPPKETREKSLLYPKVSSVLPKAFELITNVAPTSGKSIETLQDSTKNDK
jgi:membrane protein required for colicin V production